MKKSKRRYVFPDGQDYPIIESTKSGMILMATQEDLDNAQPGDAYHCVLAQCAIRMGAARAFVAGSVAYIVMPIQGELCALRFSVPPKTRKAIQHFDETGEMPLDGFELTPLSKDKTQDQKKVSNAKRSSRSLKWKPTKEKVPQGEQLRTYRHLSGAVHTIESK